MVLLAQKSIAFDVVIRLFMRTGYNVFVLLGFLPCPSIITQRTDSSELILSNFSDYSLYTYLIGQQIQGNTFEKIPTCVHDIHDCALSMRQRRSR